MAHKQEIEGLRQMAASLRNAVKGDDIDWLMDTAWDAITSMEFVANQLDKEDEKAGQA